MLVTTFTYERANHTVQYTEYSRGCVVAMTDDTGQAHFEVVSFPEWAIDTVFDDDADVFAELTESLSIAAKEAANEVWAWWQ